MSAKLLLVLVSSVWTQASVVAVQQHPSSYHPLGASSPNKVQPPIVASFGDLKPRPHSKEKGAKIQKSNHDNGAFELLLLLLLIQKRK
jgi:hypothetical protein